MTKINARSAMPRDSVPVLSVKPAIVNDHSLRHNKRSHLYHEQQQQQRDEQLAFASHSHSVPAAQRLQKHQQRRRPSAASVILTRCYRRMKAQVAQETAVLQSILAARKRSSIMLAYQQQLLNLPVTETSTEAYEVHDPLLGSFLSHFVSSHVPAIHSYPEFSLKLGRDRFQTHIAQCFTLNQVQQTLSRMRDAVKERPFVFAYLIGQGLGVIQHSEDGIVTHSGERLLRAIVRDGANLIVMVTDSHPSDIASLMPADLAEWQSQRLRFISQLVRMLLRDFHRCKQELTQELNIDADASIEQRKQEHKRMLEAEEMWRTTAESAHGYSRGQTFLTQDESEESYHAFSESHQDITLTSLSTPSQYIHVPPQSRNHLLRIRSQHALQEQQMAQARAVSPQVDQWTREALMQDMLSIWNVNGSEGLAWLTTSSMLAKVFHVQPCCPLEAAMTINQSIYDDACAWVQQQKKNPSQRPQVVQSFDVVRDSIASLYLLEMNSLSPMILQSRVKLIAQQATPHFLTRLCFVAIGMTLQWRELDWTAVQLRLQGRIVLRHRAAFRAFDAELPESVVVNPQGPLLSALNEDEEKAAPEVASAARTEEKSNSETLSDNKPIEIAFIESDRPLSGRYSGSAEAWRAAQFTATHSQGRSDLLAHLLSVDLFDMSERTLSTVHAILAEPGFADGIASPLVEALVQWLLLVLRCNRLWRAALAVFTVASSMTALERSTSRGTSKETNRMAASSNSTEIGPKIQGVMMSARTHRVLPVTSRCATNTAEASCTDSSL